MQESKLSKQATCTLNQHGNTFNYLKGRLEESILLLKILLVRFRIPFDEILQLGKIVGQVRLSRHLRTNLKEFKAHTTQHKLLFSDTRRSVLHLVPWINSSKKTLPKRMDWYQLWHFFSPRFRTKTSNAAGWLVAARVFWRMHQNKTKMTTHKSADSAIRVDRKNRFRVLGSPAKNVGERFFQK